MVNLKISVDINSGAALVFFVICFFAFLGLVAGFPPIEKNFLAGGGILVGAFGGYLKKRDRDNVLDLEAAKGNLGQKLNEIKAAAAGLANGPCPSEGEPKP
jgi:hypothetical protein